MVFSSMPVFIRHYNQPSLAELFCGRGTKKKQLTSVVVNSDGMIHIKNKKCRLMVCFHLFSHIQQHPLAKCARGLGFLQLGLGLGLLEDGLHLGSLHDVALDLELAGHEEALGLGLAGDELAKVLVGERQSDWRFEQSQLNKKSLSKNEKEGEEKSIPVGFSPTPVPTVPFSLRSMCQLAVSPALFLRVKAKTALPFLMASLRSASLLLRAALMASKASEEGNASASARALAFRSFILSCFFPGGPRLFALLTVLERHCGREL